MSLQNKLVNYLVESKAELKKVTWPTKQELMKHTLIVIGLSLFIAFFLGALDFGFSKLLSLVI